MQDEIFTICTAKFQRAKELSYINSTHETLPDPNVWLIGPDGMLFLIKDSAERFYIHAHYPVGNVGVFIGWATPTASGTLVPRKVGRRNRHAVGNLPSEILQEFLQAQLLPKCDAFYAIQDKGKVVALYFSKVGERSVLHHSLFVLRGSPVPPDVMVIREGVTYINAVELEKLRANKTFTYCNPLIGASKHPVVWHKGDEKGNGTGVIIRDGWTGMGEDSLAVYEYWKAPNSVNPEKALRTGVDLREHFH